MADLEKIRFITLNYSRLQGLKAVPTGLLLVLIVLWTNAQTGRARDLSLPILWLIVGVVFYALIDWFYRRMYGRVEQTGRSLIVDVVFATAFGVVALGAEILDGKSWIPVSIFPLVFALGLMLDHVRMCRLAGVKHLTIFPAGLAFVGLLALSSFLPLLGTTTLKEFGFRSPLFLVYAVDGILIVLFGLAGHLYLVRSMSSTGEVHHGQPV
jgi:hypothetical protein